MIALGMTAMIVTDATAIGIALTEIAPLAAAGIVSSLLNCLCKLARTRTPTAYISTHSRTHMCVLFRIREFAFVPAVERCPFMSANRKLM